ncbi:MAG: glycosyltransferase family 4 protein, partial [Pirellulaceae bacterium]
MPLRLALVSPRYWPLAGDVEMHWLRLIEQFRLADNRVTVVTATWQRGWPKIVLVREVPVERLRPAPRGGMSALRYIYALSKWLQSRQHELDAVLVSSLRYEAYSAVRTLGNSRIPVVLQAEQAGPSGDVCWQQQARFGGRIARRCRQARRVIATSRAIEGELQRAGYEAARVVTIPRGIPLPPLANATLREAARESLAGANHDLQVGPSQPVALACGRFVPEQGFVELVKAWRTVAARFPAARLWLVGDGPQRSLLYQLIGDLDLRQRISMPGTFAETDELLEAADLFLHPATVEASTLRLAEALAAGKPVIASDLPGNREWLSAGENGVLVSPGDCPALAAAIVALLAEPARGIELGAAARRRIKQ